MSEVMPNRPPPAEVPVEDTTGDVDEPSDIVRDELDAALDGLDELRGFFNALRAEFDALKQKVERPSEAWADAAKPTPVDQEAVNLAQLGAMMGIDQPSPLDRKEQEIIAAVEARIETVTEAPMAESAVEFGPKARGVPRGFWLILAFVAIVGVIVLVITQT